MAWVAWIGILAWVAWVHKIVLLKRHYLKFRKMYRKTSVLESLDNSECDLQQDIMLFDVIWLIHVKFLVHMLKEKSKVDIAGASTA